MFKKGITAIIIISLVFVMSITSFSENDKNEYVNIINPEVGASGKIISDNSLFFSIFVMQDVELTLDLIKTDTPVFVFEEEMENFKEEIRNIKDSEQLGVEEEKVLASSIESKELLFDFEKPEPLSKDSISRSYRDAQDNFKNAKRTYFIALDKIKNIPETLNKLDEDFDPTYELTYEDIMNLDQADLALEAYNEAIIQNKYWEKTYYRLFENKILSNIDLDVDALLPYFEYTVNGIEEGTYKLMIKLKESQEVVEVLEFEVITEESLVDKIFEDVFMKIDLFDAIMESK